MENIETWIEKAGVKPTAVRILVFKCLKNSQFPLSMSELEEKLDSVDKSTISRTLSVFKANHLIHSFNDGSGSVKYEICKSGGHHTTDDMHVHFRCENCGATICLEDVNIPPVVLPEGYLTKESTYVITGICPQCNLA